VWKDSKKILGNTHDPVDTSSQDQPTAKQATIIILHGQAHSTNPAIVLKAIEKPMLALAVLASISFSTAAFAASDSPCPHGTGGSGNLHDAENPQNQHDT
jgi:hypothetical protein